MSTRDYYEIMGLKKNATEKDIKMAYRRLARKYHPDINKEADAEEKFKELGQAYEVLKDPQKKAAYDQFGHQGPHQGSGQNQQYYQQGGEQFHTHWGNADFDEEDILSSIFGHARPKRPAQRKGEDYQANITLTLEEAYTGTNRQIELPVYVSTPEGQMQMKTQTISVKIPAGVKEGQKIRVPGQGGPGFQQGPAGDLYLTVHFHKHPVFEIKEKDIWLTLPVTPWEAALGATLKVPTLGGAVDLKIPKTSQAGQKLRLKGRGLPGNPAGDQLVVLKILIPQPHTDASVKLYQEMAEQMPFNPRAHMGV